MFFVGDAAGRVDEHPTGRKQDHSDTDRKFAMNLSIPFYTPEEYFLGDKPGKYVLGAFNPMDYIQVTESLVDTTSTAIDRPSTESIQMLGKIISLPIKPDVVLFVGSPASGKSSFYQEHLMPLGYARINQDTLKTREKCVEEAAALLENGLSIVIGILIPILIESDGRQYECG